MVDYLKVLKKPLPELATEAIGAAEEFRKGTISRAALKSVDAKVTDYLRGRKNPPTDGAEGAIRASGWTVELVEKPYWGGGAGEVLAWCLELVDLFESDHEAFEKIVYEKFKTPPSRA